MKCREPAGEPRGLPFHEPAVAAAHAVAQGAALMAALFGAAGLSGWILGNGVLKSMLPGVAASMKPNTAVALLLLGLSVFMVARRPVTPRAIAVTRTAAVLGALVGGLVLVEYTTGAGPGIDEFLFKDDTAGVATGVPGRMAPDTAVALTLGGVASLCASTPRLPAWTSQIPGLAVLGLGMLRLYGFAYAVPELERFGHHTGMALHTALALVLLGLAAFVSRPEEGAAGLLLNAGTTGALGRRLFAATLMAPLLLGWGVLAGQDAGLYGTRLGSALLVCGHVVVFSVVIFAALVVGRRLEMAHARAQVQVRQNELLQAFMDHTPAVMFIKDLDGRFLAVNTRFEESTGLSREQVLGSRERDVLTPDMAHRARLADLDMLARGTPTQREESFDLPGGPRDFLTTLFPLNDPCGSPYAVAGVLADITERVAAQRETQWANRRFLALLESAPDATLITDGDGTIVMANAQVESLFGHAPAAVVGAAIEDLVPGPRRPLHSALLRRYLQRADPKPAVLDRGLHGLHSDGSVFPVEVSVSTFQAEQDTLVFLTVRDITERRQAEAERAERYEQQRRIANTLQHSLMAEPPRLPHLPSAHRYLASVQHPGLGGDWFDIIPLDRNHTGIVIGDVMGRGLDAAAVMGQLRAAAHALARTGIPPCQVMTGLDAFVSDLADQLVTCCYLVIDHDAPEVTLCSAGHLPVVAVAPRGSAHLLRAPISVPLGVNDSCGVALPFQETTHRLPLGSTLALFTDGLVERPGTDIDAQIDVLARTLEIALKGAPTDPQILDEATARLIGTLIPDPATHDDDVTLLLIAVPEPEEAAAGPTARNSGPRARLIAARRAR